MFFEFTHDSLAQAVFDKVSVEEKTRRKVERFIEDRFAYYEAQGVLLNQKDLSYIQPYLDQVNITPEARAFIRKSQSNSQRRRVLILAAVLAMLLISTLGGVAWYQRTEAVVARKESDANRQAAEENEKIALQNADLARIQKDSADANATKARINATAAQIAKDRADSLRLVAVVAADSAEKRRVEAVRLANDLNVSKQEEEKARLDAEQAASLADQARLAAEAAERRTDTLRKQALAKSLALKALQIDDEVERQQVAQSAFQLQDTFANSLFDSDIYNALYFALWERDRIPPFPVHTGPVRGMVISPSALLTTGSDGYLKGTPYPINPTNQPQTFLKVDDLSRALAVDDHPSIHAWVGTERGWIYQVNRQQDSLLSQVKVHQGAIWAVAWNPIDRAIYSGGADGYLIRLQADNKTCDTLAQGLPLLKHLAVLNDGNVLGATEQGELILCEEQNGGTCQVQQVLDQSITALALSPDNRYLAIGDDRGLIRIMNWPDLQPVATLLVHQARISDLAFSPKGTYLASASWDRTALLWQVPDFNQQPISLRDHANRLESLTFSQDERQLWVGLSDGQLKMWRTEVSELFNILKLRIDMARAAQAYEKKPQNKQAGSISTPNQHKP